MKYDNQVISKAEIEFYKREKKTIQPSPDIDKMQMVKMSDGSMIYISMDASAEDARNRYEQYLKNRK